MGDIEAEVAFVRGDGVNEYIVYACWDNSLKGWLQWGAHPDVLKENVSEVQRYYYSKHSFDFRGVANEIRRSI